LSPRRRRLALWHVLTFFVALYCKVLETLKHPYILVLSFLHGDALLVSALCNNQSDVISLLAFTKILYGLDDGLEKSPHRQMALRKRRLDEARLVKLYLLGVLGFCDAVGVKNQGVTRGELNFRNRAVPLLE
jgi:hypothetical protein